MTRPPSALRLLIKSIVQAEAKTRLWHANAEANHVEQRSTQQELERLQRLRQNLASVLLEVSRAAERDAKRLMADSAAGHQAGPFRDASAEGRERSFWTAWRLAGGTFALGVTCGLLLALLLESDGRDPVEVASVSHVAPSRTPDQADAAQIETPASADDVESPFRDDAVAEVGPDRGVEPIVAPAPATRADSANDSRLDASSTTLALTLTARDTCWIRAQVDDQESWERLLPPGEVVRLQAADQATLRIGDAGAISMQINGHDVRPLGRPGQAITMQVTAANYQSFVVDGASGP